MLSLYCYTKMQMLAKEIGELWMEYEENSSPEAKIVKDFDKVHLDYINSLSHNSKDRH